MINLTKEDVQNAWKYMSKYYDFDIIDKSNAKEMQIAGWALELMDIQDSDDFLKRYTTTIGRNIYVPFEIGEGSQSKLKLQLCTLAHEAQHVVQFRRNSGKFVFRYLTSDAARASYEADALRANMEMYWYMTGKLLSPKKLSDSLVGYSIGDDDRRVVYKNLMISSKVVKRGGVITGTSKTLIKWMQNNVEKSPVVIKPIFVRF